MSESIKNRECSTPPNAFLNLFAYLGITDFSPEGIKNELRKIKKTEHPDINNEKQSEKYNWANTLNEIIKNGFLDNYIAMINLVQSGNQNVISSAMGVDFGQAISFLRRNNFIEQARSVANQPTADKKNDDVGYQQQTQKSQGHPDYNRSTGTSRETAEMVNLKRMAISKAEKIILSIGGREINDVIRQFDNLPSQYISSNSAKKKFVKKLLGTVLVTLYFNNRSLNQNNIKNDDKFLDLDDGIIDFFAGYFGKYID